MAAMATNTAGLNCTPIPQTWRQARRQRHPGLSEQEDGQGERQGRPTSAEASGDRARATITLARHDAQYPKLHHEGVGDGIEQHRRDAFVAAWTPTRMKPAWLMIEE